MHYRKELDGLRAIAVMAVIFYHAELTAFGRMVLPGGYFGVDIFFVLSGFLITSILVSRERIDLKQFFFGRFRRIYPMLLVVLVATSVYAYNFLMPAELEIYAGQLQAAVGSYSNIYFLSEDSYVSEASKLKPLIHTWSLGVEWQFYLIFPFLLIFIRRFLAGHLLGSIAALMLASFALCIYLSYGNLDASFYLPFTRSWELFAGAFVCLYARSRSDNGMVGSMLPLVGLVMMLAPMFLFDDKQVHPGYITLLPVIGCCLFIMYTKQDTVISRMLSMPPFAFLGLISYSLYLWHQPFFAFYRLRFEDFTWGVFGVMLPILILLSYLSFKLIENPFRRSGNGKKHIAFVSMVFACLGFSSIAQSTHGFPERLEGVARQAYSEYRMPEFRKLTTDVPGSSVRGTNTMTCIFRMPSSACRFGDESWITVGDSFAGMYEPELKRALEDKGHGLVTMSYEQCPLLDEDIWVGDAPECTVINRERWKAIDSMTGKKTFVVSGSFTQFYKAKKGIDDPLSSVRSGFVSVDSDAVYRSFARSVEAIIGRGHRVILIYPTPSVMTNVKNKIYKEALYSGATSGKFVERVDMTLISKVESDIDVYVADSPLLTRIKPTKVFCKDSLCEVIDSDGGLFNVTSHLSNIGARKVIAEFL